MIAQRRFIILTAKMGGLGGGIRETPAIVNMDNVSHVLPNAHGSLLHFNCTYPTGGQPSLFVTETLEQIADKMDPMGLELPA